MVITKQYFITHGEMVAYDLVNRGKPLTTQNSDYHNYREAGNKIIELAERIKTERLNCLLEN